MLTPETAVAPVDPDEDLQSTETPAEPLASPTTVEAPPASAEGLEAESLETPDVSEGPTRDDQGRYAKADGTLSALGEAAPPPEEAESEDLDALVERGDYD